MTGGTPEAGRINATLARVAETLGLAMGLGSGRVLFERPEVVASFAIRRYALVPCARQILGVDACVRIELSDPLSECRRNAAMLYSTLVNRGRSNLLRLFQVSDDRVVRLTWRCEYGERSPVGMTCTHESARRLNLELSGDLPIVKEGLHACGAHKSFAEVSRTASRRTLADQGRQGRIKASLALPHSARSCRFRRATPEGSAEIGSVTTARAAR
jgi:hypothetical protein